MPTLDPAETLIDAGRAEDALRLADLALAETPGDWRAHAVRARALRALQRSAAALDALDAARRLNQASALVEDARGVLLAEAGRLDAARAAFAAALACDPRCARAYFGLATLGPVAPAQLAAMQALAADPAPLDEAQRLFLLYALCKGFDDAGDVERAFAAAEAGAALRRPRWRGDAEHEIERLRRAAPRAPVAVGEDDAAPVFVIGMLRSGTTLVEQILGRSPGALALGETEAFARAVGTADPRAAYLAAIPPLGGRRGIDKSLGNALHVAAILAAFPGARFVAVRRDPLDVGLSCHFAYFAHALPFPPDLAAIGRYARAHAALLDAWAAVLPSRTWRDIVYERLVADPKREARALVAFAGLAWDPRCLSSADAGPVRTASLAQVRAPIHAGAVGRWRRYAAWLGPLRAALEGEAAA